MFVYTIKWNKTTALLIILIAALVICGIIFAIAASGGSSSSSVKVKDNDDRLDFLASLNWEVEEQPISERKIIIPKEFSKVYTEYNNLQKAQGYDLSKYCGLEATIFTYRVTNYTGYTGNVVAEIYVLNFEIIGGDIHSLELDGFMHGLTAKK